MDTYYLLGKRDCLCEILMHFRVDENPEKTLLNLSKLIPDNCHAKYFIEKYDN